MVSSVLIVRYKILPPPKPFINEPTMFVSLSLMLLLMFLVDVPAADELTVDWFVLLLLLVILLFSATLA